MVWLANFVVQFRTSTRVETCKPNQRCAVRFNVHVPVSYRNVLLLTDCQRLAKLTAACATRTLELDAISKSSLSTISLQHRIENSFAQETVTKLKGFWLCPTIPVLAVADETTGVATGLFSRDISTNSATIQ